MDAAPLTEADFLLSARADDEGNAQCVAHVHAGEFAYCAAYGWLHWTGTHWESRDAEAALDRAVVDTLIKRETAASNAKRDDLVKRCIPTARHIKDTKYLLQSILTVGVDQFDSDPDLLNCKNGAVYLPTGQVFPHDSARHFTYCVPVEYEPTTDLSEWVGFLRSVITQGEDVLDFVGQATGYSLTGHTSEECLFYVTGPTRAGKGTFQEALTNLLPKPIAYQVDFSTFTAKRDGDANNFDLAPLKPARLVFASESNKHQSLNPGKIKQLTGGDDVYCAHKFRPHFSYRPQYKIWLVSNHAINADVDDDALWYRIRVIEFPNSLAGREDKRLKTRMKTQKAQRAILAWAIRGAIKWYQNGQDLKMPEAVSLATNRQRAALDYVGNWLEACTEPGEWTANGTLYTSYENFCEENGIEPKQQRGFSDALKAKGYEIGVVKKVASGATTRVLRGVRGLKLAEI
jgi:putative DNA primase/helicase